MRRIYIVNISFSCNDNSYFCNFFDFNDTDSGVITFFDDISNPSVALMENSSIIAFVSDSLGLVLYDFEENTTLSNIESLKDAKG